MCLKYLLKTCFLSVPHGDHHDFLVEGYLHHPHLSHCDDHGLYECSDSPLLSPLANIPQLGKMLYGASYFDIMLFYAYLTVLHRFADSIYNPENSLCMFESQHQHTHHSHIVYACVCDSMAIGLSDV